MLLEQLWAAIPDLRKVIEQQPLVHDQETVWVFLRQLLLSHAPANGVTLPGGIFDRVTDVAAAIGLADRLAPAVAGKGSGGLWLGVAKERPDLVVMTNLDRPTFRIYRLFDAQTAEVRPSCRSGGGTEYQRLAARALRFDPNQRKLRVSAQGYLRTEFESSAPRHLFEVERGSVNWGDAVVLALPPVRQGDKVVGTGLDNCAGILLALGVAAVIRSIEEKLLEHNSQCLFVFTGCRDDQWAGGYQMLPSIGTVVINSPIAQDSEFQDQAGIAYCFGDSSRQLVAMNYQQLTYDLAVALRAVHPTIAQPAHNLDDLLVSQEGISLRQIVGLMGPPITCDKGQETVALADIQSGIWWTVCYLCMVLNLVPEISLRYALER